MALATTYELKMGAATREAFGKMLDIASMALLNPGLRYVLPEPQLKQGR